MMKITSEQINEIFKIVSELKTVNDNAVNLKALAENERTKSKTNGDNYREELVKLVKVTAEFDEWVKNYKADNFIFSESPLNDVSFVLNDVRRKFNEIVDNYLEKKGNL